MLLSDSSPNYFWFTPDQGVGFQHFCYDRKFVYPARVQDEYVIVLCLSGEISVSESERTECLLPGEMLIGNCRHWRSSRYGENGKCEGLTLVVGRKRMQSALRNLGDARFDAPFIPCFPGKVEMEGLQRIAEDVVREIASRERGRSQILEALAQEMLLRSVRAWPNIEVQELDTLFRVLARRQYVSALDYMQSRGKNEFSLEGMCRQVGLSVAEFSRLFRRCTTQTPLATYNRLLMDRAMAALRGGAGSIKEVSYDLGFDSPSQFTALFHKTMGLRPSQVRSAQIL